MTYIFVAVTFYSFAFLLGLILCMAAGKADVLLEAEAEESRPGAREKHRDVA